MSRKVAERSDSELIPWELQEDLATVACYAAGEVDDTILEREKDFKAVELLIEIINNLIVRNQSHSRKCIVDPRTAMVIGQALEHSYPEESIDTVDELIIASRRIVNLLKQLVTNPQKIQKNKKSELKKLRGFCLALSDSALAYEKPIDE